MPERGKRTTLSRAESAQRQSENSQRNAEAAQRQSEAAQRSAEASQRQSEVSQRQADLQRQASSDAQFNAEAARLQTQDAQARSRQLEERLRDLEAKKTNRGLVITLGDVLFDSNRAQLKSGGMRDTQKLADFLRHYPQRTVMIEGYTDSSGTNERNHELSEQRASSVRMALMDGIATERIAARGYGESYPVAGNDTAAGRQLNRRWRSSSPTTAAGLRHAEIS